MSKPFGSKGKVVYIHQTGEWFSTIQEACQELGISRSLFHQRDSSEWLSQLQIEVTPPDKKSCTESARLKYNYGITLEDYENILAKQKNTCVICHQAETAISNESKKVKKLSVDHNHVTGEVRGLLCDRCNRLLGYARESIPILQNAINYLRGEK